jgi:Na+-transporting NADH:ubiquinone oxidoreductase subunit NqrD
MFPSQDHRGHESWRIIGDLNLISKLIIIIIIIIITDPWNLSVELLVFLFGIFDECGLIIGQNVGYRIQFPPTKCWQNILIYFKTAFFHILPSSYF